MDKNIVLDLKQRAITEVALTNYIIQKARRHTIFRETGLEHLLPTVKRDIGLAKSVLIELKT